ncbi:AAA family ATPase [Burkholderia sp. GS2Y]|uniref:AAA family ATPase n=1 Tax=Burkholderia theae TaxID=3143496 RepID=A0ABU9WI84_9BURK
MTTIDAFGTAPARQILWQDNERILCRERSDDGMHSVLAMRIAAAPSSPQAFTRLVHEFALRDRLEAAWAVRPRAFVRNADGAALLCEDPGGEPLEAILGAALETGAALRLAIGIAAALRQLHQCGVVHRDLRPCHILVNGNDGSTRLTGFGVASAPEPAAHLRSAADSRDDLHAFGRVLYRMLSGEPLFPDIERRDEPTDAAVARSAMQPVEPLETIPATLSALVMKLLATPPEARYQTAGAVENDLRRCLDAWSHDGRIEPFALGEHDAHSRPCFTTAIPGRAGELAVLADAFARVKTSGRFELMLVSGAPGAGKSTLVDQPRTTDAPPHAFFTSVALTESDHGKPYSALMQALRELVRQLLGRGAAEFAHWRNAIATALGANVRLLVDRVPELTHLIDVLPAVPTLEGDPARRRLHAAFRSFIGVFARPGHPLTLCFDELQWLDADSLDVLEASFVATELRHLLLVGVCRSGGADAAHPLTHRLEEIRRAGFTVGEIALGPVSLAHLQQWLAKLIRCEPASATALAALLHERTDGNPGAVIRLLHACVDSDALAFDHDGGKWSWNIANVRDVCTATTEHTTMATFAHLPVDTRHALQILACFGTSAPVDSLSAVLGLPPERVLGRFRPALAQALVKTLDGTYAFSQERTREILYARIPDPERADAHLRIGRLLAARLAPDERAVTLFEVVNHLNLGAARMASRDERERLAVLNMRAAAYAKTTAAYESALAYLACGAQHLARDGDCPPHALQFALECDRADCERLTGRIAAAHERLARLSAQAMTVTEHARVACLRSDVCAALDRHEDVVALCIDCLRRIGVAWPSHPGDEDVRREYRAVRSALADDPVEHLVDLPPMRDPASIATAEVLIALLRATSTTDANHSALATCRVISLSLEQGVCDASCVAFAMFPRIATSRFGDVATGQQLGQLGFELVERRNLVRFEAAATLCHALYVVRWTAPLRTSSAALARARDAARRVRDPALAADASGHLVSNRLFAGAPLIDVYQEAERCIAASGVTSFGSDTYDLRAQLALVRMLRGLTPDFGTLDDGEFSETVAEHYLSGSHARTAAACRYRIRQLQARYLAGDLAAALDAAAAARPLLWTVAAQFDEIDYHFYAALAHAARCDAATGGERQRHLTAVAHHGDPLQTCAQRCPDHVADKAALVSAEISRLDGRDSDAMHRYEEAIRLARANGFIHDEALANELAARFYLARGFDKIGRVYLQDARHGYRRWGADGKVRQLDGLYPGLCDDERARQPAAGIGTPVEHLDLATVIRVSQAISSEIVRDRLIDVMMRTAIEQAGAVRGLLVLPGDDAPRIAAEVSLVDDTQDVRLCDEPAAPAAMPVSILHHVLRTRESVVLDDAAREPAFATDVYVRRYRVRSILCLPLVNRAHLVGALYLENGHQTRAFTPARIAVLRLLASQAAASLETTRLYHDLEEREARIRRLVDANIIGIFFWRLEGDTPESSDAVLYDVNDAFLKMVGYSRDDFASGRVRRSNITPPEWVRRTALAHTELITTGTFQPYEKEYLRNDGTRVPVLVGTAAFDAGGRNGVAFVLDLTERKDAEHRLRESYDMLRELASRRETAREEERKRIAREMHDELGQHLTAFRMRTSALRLHFGDRLPQLAEETRALANQVDDTMRLVRRVIASLRPPALDTGIAAALEWLVAEFNRNGGTKCHLRIDNENIDVSERCAIVLFRLAQEALTNIARHAGATHAIISLERTADTCLLDILDDGKGFDPRATRTRSFGLAGMEERVRMLRGRIEIASLPGIGTSIKVSIPDVRDTPDHAPD